MSRISLKINNIEERKIMKKRIISLILVVVMAVLTLASCAYSYADDDMTQYATFDKAAFAAAIKEFDIEDADFTEDEETRVKKVLDKIYTTLAGKADTEDHKTEVVPGVNDTLPQLSTRLSISS